MKRMKYALLAAALTVASVAAVPASDSEAAVKGTWKQDSKGWWVAYSKGYAKSEWFNGYWIKKDGYWDGVSKKATWKKDSKGWWFGYKGWYAKNQWQKIDGSWYYFDKQGYMAADEFIKGDYVNKNGAWDGSSKKARWQKDSKGWWYGYKGWYAKSRWWKIDGTWYYFDSEGYMAADEFVGGYYLNKNGAYVPGKYLWRKGTGADAKKQWFGVNKDKCVKNGWYTINQQRYYFDKDGWLVTWDVREVDGKVYGFDSEGHEKPITKVALGKTVEAKVVFDLADKKAAAEDMNAFLVVATKENEKKYMDFDGVKKLVKNENGAITVDGKKLTDYVATYSKTSVTVESSGSVDRLFAGLKITGTTSASYVKSVTFGDVKFDGFNIQDGKVYFQVAGTYYRCLFDVDKKVGYFLTDVTKETFYNTLVSAKVFDSAATKTYTEAFPAK